MKNILVWGTGRAGKTTLAGMAHRQLGLKHVEMDLVRNKYHEDFPDRPSPIMPCYGGIVDDVAETEILSQVMLDFLKQLEKSNDPFIAESVYLDPTVLKGLNKSKYLIIGIGNAQISGRNKLTGIRQHDTAQSWTSHYGDEYVLPYCDFNIEQSKHIQKTMAKLGGGARYFDTSTNRDQELATALEYIQSAQMV